MILIVIVFIFMLILTPFTGEIKSVPTHDDCYHITVTLWFGLIKTADVEKCESNQRRK